jgi:transposase
VFNAWIKQDLILKLPAQSIVLIDNASFHKGEEMKKALSDAGHTLLYLPPYSPDLNPIEGKWAQCKAKRRKMRCSIEELFQDLNL